LKKSRQNLLKCIVLLVRRRQFLFVHQLSFRRKSSLYNGTTTSFFHGKENGQFPSGMYPVDPAMPRQLQSTIHTQ